MEGDNQRRRGLARQAREEGRQPSEAGVTLGASKQPEHVDKANRDGPPPAGAHKHPPGAPEPSRPPPAGKSRPRWDPAEMGVAPPDGPAAMKYREFIQDVGQRTGLAFDDARMATEATVTALARTLFDTGRQRLLDALPAELRDAYLMEVPHRPRDLAGFLNEIAQISRRTAEEARYHAQAALGALAERNSALVESLELPPYLRELAKPPRPGGGLVSPTRHHAAPLTDEELAAALARLPQWSGTTRALVRTIELPPDNLERVLRRLERLREETGRAPEIGRQDDRTAVVTVRTSSVDAVTAADVELAHRVDAAIEEAGAGMA